MPLVVAEFLEHILDELNYLSRNAQQTNKESFLKDETLQRSFVRSIEIIGEAAKQIPESVRTKVSSNPVARHGRYEGSAYSQLFWS